MSRPIPAALAALMCLDAAAATFVVNNTAVDRADLTPGDGICAWSTAVPAGERCTLRAAIMEANAFPGPDTIVVPFSAHIVLDRSGRNEDAGATGDLDITEVVLIRTPSVSSPATRPIIDANGIDRVFDIRPNAGTVTFSNLAIRNGSATDVASPVGGGIRAEDGTDLVLGYCTVETSEANAGGGIHTRGRLTLFASLLRANTALDLGITNPFGSAIKDADGGPDPGDEIVISRSTVQDNVALGSFFRAAVQLKSPTNIENSTFSNNLPNALSFYATTAYLNHLTITGSEVGYSFGGNASANTSALYNSIVAGNSVSDCSFGGTYVTYQDFSLDSDGTCLLSTGAGNLPNVDPLLQPIGLRYGYTPVHNLKRNSPAIDKGDPQMLGSGGTCLSDDQDGLARPIDGDGGGARCDMGAIEYLDRIFADGFDPLP